MTDVSKETPTAATLTVATPEMIKLGITNHPIDRFHYGEYKYTNLGDALAEAKRNPPKT